MPVLHVVNCTGNLTNVDIPFTVGSTGLFVWIDLSDHLPTADWNGEQLLHQMMANQQVMLVPGKQLGASEPGFFRMGLGSETTQTLTQAIDRVANMLETV